MLTRRAWIVVAAAAGLLVAGRLLGIMELFVLAVAGLALVVASLVAVRLPRLALRATRELRPTTVHAGSDSRVEIAIGNDADRRCPVVTVRDPFDDGRRQARFLLRPLDPGQAARAAYRLPTERRGVFTIGPLEANVIDPFGLAIARWPVAPETELTVYPRVDRIVALPQTEGLDPHAGADRPSALGYAGEDFFALRPYEVGDDLRRVHWPSTARTGEIMIRQHEMPWQGRATVLLDTRAATHHGDSFEVAVSAAASIVTTNWSQGSLVRLVTTDGMDSGTATGQAHVEAIMEHLAVVAPSRHDRLAPVLGQLGGSGTIGALVAVVTADVPDADLDRIVRARSRAGSLTVVMLERSVWEPETGVRERPLTVVGTVVRVSASRPFATAWDRALASRVGGRAQAHAHARGWR